MADVKIPKSIPCQFDSKGWNPCKKPSDNGWCSEHENLKCASCGGKAVRNCYAQMGGLACGVPLCESCQHSEEGVHITVEIYHIQAQERKVFERTGEESPRMLAKRGIPSGMPRNLQEVTSGDLQGWTSKTCWTLEILHSLMGFFPVRVKTAKILVIVFDRPLIFRIWRSLPPRLSKLVEFNCMVDSHDSVGYLIRSESGYDKTQSLPQKLFSAHEIEQLFAQDSAPFEWTPGLLGASIGSKEFHRIIDHAEAGDNT